MNLKEYFSNLYVAIKGGRSTTKAFKRQMITEALQDIEKAAIKGIDLEMDKGLDLLAFLSVVAKEYYLKSVEDFHALSSAEIATCMKATREKLVSATSRETEEKLAESKWDESALEELKKDGKLIAFRIPDKKSTQ